MTTPTPSTDTGDTSTDPRKDSLIEYPSDFPIKVMGLNQEAFVHAVTITVTATSREQLDNLYRALTSNPLVKVVL